MGQVDGVLSAKNAEVPGVVMSPLGGSDEVQAVNSLPRPVEEKNVFLWNSLTRLMKELLFSSPSEKKQNNRS